MTDPPPNGWLPGQTAQSPLKNRVGLTGTRAHSNCPGNESRSSPSPPLYPQDFGTGPKSSSKLSTSRACVVGSWL